MKKEEIKYNEKEMTIEEKKAALKQMIEQVKDSKILDLIFHILIRV